ncbi:MAG: hypothetical protein LN413_00010 [Candidatus Thermoplasmatota archaeon]|nr:hypothetical protein [Candidatus Thermoplasmatota archaeon]
MYGRKAMGRQLTGFEDALAAQIEASSQAVPPTFRFAHPGIKDLILSEGRHIFLQELPHPDEIKTEDPLLDDYDATREPTIGIFTETGSGIVPSSGIGGRHEWTLRIVLRAGTVFETAKEHLENLIEYLELNLPSEFGGFAVASVIIESRPRVFARREDDHAYCEAVLRFMVVPTT